VGYVGTKKELDHDILASAASGDHDISGILETPDDVDDPLLSSLHIAEADWSHEFHVLLDDLCGTG
jgi:hypothetical protein